MRATLIAAIVLLSALVFAGGASASDDGRGLTLTSHHAYATAVAAARLDPEDNPYAVVCRLENGWWALEMWKAIFPFDPPVDGRACFSG